MHLSVHSRTTAVGLSFGPCLQQEPVSHLRRSSPLFSIVQGMSDQQRPMLHLALHVAPAVLQVGLAGTVLSVARPQRWNGGNEGLKSSQEHSLRFV
jgi:hypothetical protein